MSRTGAPLASAGGQLVFIDWAGLKERHDGVEVDGDSPAAEREALLRAIAASDAVPLPLDQLEQDGSEDPDDPTASPADWGWDRTDLRWELRIGPTTTVLRFEAPPDSDGLRAQAEERGLVREVAGTGEGRDPGDVTYGSTASDAFGMTFSDGGRTVVIERGGSGTELVALARDREPVEVAGGPFGRAASQLGRPLVARLYRGADVCSGTGEENALLRGAEARLAASVGRMQPYEVLGVGYTASEAEEGLRGRYVFDYGRVRHATADLAGRRALVERGTAPDGRRERDDGFRLAEAGAIGQDIVIDVVPRDATSGEQARRLFEELTPGRRGEPSLLGICGPAPSDEPLTRRPTADVPIFVGPASLSLSGGPGIHRWDEARFGADEVRLRATLHAGGDPCALWLEATDDGHRRSRARPPPGEPRVHRPAGRDVRPWRDRAGRLRHGVAQRGVDM